MKKKDYPLDILKQLNELKKNYPDVSRIEKSNGLLKYCDIDDNSDFYYEIKGFLKRNHNFYYSVNYKPVSANNLDIANRELKYKDLVSHIKNWSDTVKNFNETEYFDEDPIISSYTKEFFSEYKILEDDADNIPFDFKRQIIIEQYLLNSIKYLKKTEEKNPEFELSEPIELADELNRQLTSLSKNQVIQKLSKFWAVTRKKGLPLIKEVFFELAKELIKEFGKKMIGM